MDSGRSNGCTPPGRVELAYPGGLCLHWWAWPAMVDFACIGGHGPLWWTQPSATFVLSGPPAYGLVLPTFASSSVICDWECDIIWHVTPVWKCSFRQALLSANLIPQLTFFSTECYTIPLGRGGKKNTQDLRRGSGRIFWRHPFWTMSQLLPSVNSRSREWSCKPSKHFDECIFLLRNLHRFLLLGRSVLWRSIFLIQRHL